MPKPATDPDRPYEHLPAEELKRLAWDAIDAFDRVPFDELHQPGRILLVSVPAKDLERLLDVAHEASMRVSGISHAERRRLDAFDAARNLLAALDRAELLPGRARDEVRRQASALLAMLEGDRA